MRMFFSPTIFGFYDETTTNLPEDAFEITTEKWQYLLDQQSEGKQIFYEDGILDVREYVIPQEDLEEHALRQKDFLISEVDANVGNALVWASLSDEKKSEWIAYRQELVDVPNQAGFPADINWPTKPE